MVYSRVFGHYPKRRIPALGLFRQVAWYGGFFINGLERGTLTYEYRTTEEANNCLGWSLTERSITAPRGG